MLFSIMADGSKHIWVIPSLTSYGDSYLLIRGYLCMLSSSDSQVQAFSNRGH